MEKKLKIRNLIIAHLLFAKWFLQNLKLLMKTVPLIVQKTVLYNIEISSGCSIVGGLILAGLWLWQRNLITALLWNSCDNSRSPS